MKIVLSAVVAFLLIGCSDNKSTTQESTQVNASAKSEVVNKVVVAEQKVVQKKEKSVEKVVPVVTKTEKAPNKAVQSAVTAVDGRKLFTACSSCHGSKGEKKALGKSQVITGWDSVKVEHALQGYKEGTYGGAMKAVMKGQTAKLTDAEIKVLADYISKL